MFEHRRELEYEEVDSHLVSFAAGVKMSPWASGVSCSNASKVDA